MTNLSRRFLLRSLLAAPAIVAAANLMPVRALILPPKLIVPSSWEIVPREWKIVCKFMIDTDNLSEAQIKEIQDSMTVQAAAG